MQPGLRWWIFTLRIPLVHMKVNWALLLQGLFISSATALALVPIMENYFGLTLAEAVTLSVILTTLIGSSVIVFGEPYVAGWITPALPLVLAAVIGGDYQTPVERFQLMAALSLNFAVLCVLFGATGLGKWLVERLPRVLKGGIILGAAIAALDRVFIKDDFKIYEQIPVSASLAIVICLLLLFSKPVGLWRQRYPWLDWVAGLGLLPGFVLAGIVGPLIGEIHYDIQWGLIDPPLASLWAKTSPFAIGFPGWQMYWDALPLTLIAYMLLFGDLITGTEVLNDGADERPDEKLDINLTRTHYSVGIRNAIMGFIGPFFPTQGVLWTGIHVLVVNRWREGRQTMESLYDGMGSYGLFGFFLFFLALPLVTLLQPLMPVALTVTLILTAFACAYVGMSQARDPIEQGSLLMIGIAIAFFPAWLGLLCGVGLSALLLNLREEFANPGT